MAVVDSVEQIGKVAEPRSRRVEAVGLMWSLTAVALATFCFWCLRNYLDKGQASLLYLPVVIACAVRFGFSSAVVGAFVSFLCWDFFFLQPVFTFVVDDVRNWLSLIVFLIAAIVTSRLASQAKEQADAARAREEEIRTLYKASESLSREIRADHILPSLAEQLVNLSSAVYVMILHRIDDRWDVAACMPSSVTMPEPQKKLIRQISQVACEHDQVIGTSGNEFHWRRAIDDLLGPSHEPVGLYVPLHTEKGMVGVLHAGPRRGGGSFSALEEQLILTLSNHAATVIARQELAAQAAQAAALKEADTLKDALLSLVSHELRSPLAAIKVSASNLRGADSKLDEGLREEALAAIDIESDRLTRLVSNLLDLSRLEAGAWRPQKDWCDITDVVATVLDRLEPSQADRVQVDAAVDLPLIRADFVQIALVASNLIENALKYSTPGTTITVTLSPFDKIGALVRVDNIGEPVEGLEQQAIFDRFYRGKKHQNSTVHGTGLGLALCRAIVIAHEGVIFVTNTKTGPSFTVRLPIGAVAK